MFASYLLGPSSKRTRPASGGARPAETHLPPTTPQRTASRKAFNFCGESKPGGEIGLTVNDSHAWLDLPDYAQFFAEAIVADAIEFDEVLIGGGPASELDRVAAIRLKRQ